MCITDLKLVLREGTSGEVAIHDVDRERQHGFQQFELAMHIHHPVHKGGTGRSIDTLLYLP